jgi:hypothetical protein
MKHPIRLAAPAAVAFFLVACGSDDPASPNEPTTFNVTMTTAAEVPVCEDAGASAAGSGTITINAANTSITVSNLTWTGLSGAATAAHIHIGAAGAAGAPLIDFGVLPTSPFSDTFTAADYPASPPTGAPATFSAFIAAMKAGNTYVNVHTADCLPGEIRGQLIASTS